MIDIPNKCETHCQHGSLAVCRLREHLPPRNLQCTIELGLVRHLVEFAASELVVRVLADTSVFDFSGGLVFVTLEMGRVDSVRQISSDVSDHWTC